jgi:RHS repeat-associated protein
MRSSIMAQRRSHTTPNCPSSRGKIKTANNQTVATYRYDPFGRRVRKTVLIPNTTITPQNPIAQQAGTTFFGFASEGMIAEFGDNGNFKVSYAHSPALASGSHATWQTNPIYKREAKLSGDQLHAFHTDHLGTPQVLTAIASSNAANIGKLTWRANYESFGEAFIDQTILSATNLSADAATENNHRFPGQFFDVETGLAQNFFRDYEQATGRYAMSDPIGLFGGFNRYAYVWSRPSAFDDSVGLSPCAKLKNSSSWSGNQVPTPPDGCTLSNLGDSYGDETDERRRPLPDIPGLIFWRNADLSSKVGPDWGAPSGRKPPIKPELLEVDWWQNYTERTEVTTIRIRRYFSCYMWFCEEKDECGKVIKSYTVGPIRVGRGESKDPPVVTIDERQRERFLFRAPPDHFIVNPRRP